MYHGFARAGHRMLRDCRIVVVYGYGSRRPAVSFAIEPKKTVGDRTVNWQL
jgi:hypothetical protein